MNILDQKTELVFIPNSIDRDRESCRKYCSAYVVDLNFHKFYITAVIRHRYERSPSSFIVDIQSNITHYVLFELNDLCSVFKGYATTKMNNDSQKYFSK